MNATTTRPDLSAAPAAQEIIQLRQLARPAREVIDPRATLEEAARRMKGAGGGPLLVCEAGRLVGILGHRDLTAWAAAEGGDPRIARVGDAMATEVPYCFDDQPAYDAALLMHQRRLQSLIVLDRDHRLVGVVSLGDVENR